MFRTWLIFCTFASLSTKSSWALKNCRGPYNAYFQCLNQVNVDFSTVKILNDGQWNQMENDVKQKCFLQLRCSNPWGSDAVRNKRRSCFNTLRSRVKNDLVQCVRILYDPNFDLPQEALVPSVYNRFTNYMTALSRDNFVCDFTVDKTVVSQCTRQRVKALTNKTVATTVIGSSSNKCQVKQNRCDAKIDNDCYDQWQRKIRPGLRSCVSQVAGGVRLQNYKNAYRMCVVQQFPANPVQNDDPFLQYFDNLNTALGNIPETCVRKRRV